MDYALQVHEAKYVFPMPDGLKELSSDIIREVLRHQPEHINGFIADYLETMLVVREHARDTAEVVCDVVREGRFFDDLYKTKNVTRQEVQDYVTKIQAAWRGYVVRRKLTEWLKKKKKVDDERERKRTLKIEELLEGMGITYEEATRAADLIQTAYKESKRGKWISSDGGEIWLGENIPFGQRVREEDRAKGKFAKWNMEDFGDFFEMDQEGAIKYDWPRVGQLRKVLREDIPEDAKIVNFFAMRDLHGQEQYSYLIKSQVKNEKQGTIVGFLIPVSRALLLESMTEVVFVNPENARRMGNYTYIYKDTVDREEVIKFDELLQAQAKASKKNTLPKEFDYDPHWVLPRILVRIKEKYASAINDVVVFKSQPSNLICEDESYILKAESLEQTAKVVRYILREECMTVEEALVKASLPPKETGRIFLVDSVACPEFIQKIEIIPESASEADADEMALYEYVFVPLHHAGSDKLLKEEQIMKIFITRFQGYHSDYEGSSNLKNQVFVMGPKLTAVDGKPLTFESFFWKDFGEDAWHRLLYDVMCNKYEIKGEVEEEGEKTSEKLDELDYRSKGFDEIIELKGEEKTTKTSGTLTSMVEGETEITKSAKASLDKGPLTEKSFEGETARKVETKGEVAPYAAAAPDKTEEELKSDLQDSESKLNVNE